MLWDVLPPQYNHLRSLSFTIYNNMSPQQKIEESIMYRFRDPSPILGGKM